MFTGLVGADYPTAVSGGFGIVIGKQRSTGTRGYNQLLGQV